ncbi:MAG: bifunctional folylpolyglutamate synthase/dihydrofolate synthase [Candidatus Acidiferrales bacterium]
MTSDEAVRYLLALGRELASPQQARVAKFDLANTSILTERLGHPERAYPTVHIAGTNGKGSTAAMLASILAAAGLRAGLYTSPHLERIQERIRLGGREITDQEFAAAFDRIRAAIEDLLAKGRLAAHPTFFECLTAMAFDYFARPGGNEASERAEFAVFETGMGGRLDATNVISPEVAVITQIAFDHENYLGHSIEEIAGEKAGIIKPGAWVVSAAEHPAARDVIRRRAKEQNARLVEIEERFEVEHPRTERTHGSTRFEARDKESGRTIELTVPLAGRFQVRNALAALAAARLLGERGFPTDDAAIARGIAEVRWPGRLERVGEGPAVYVDGTHNPAGARELAAFWEENFSCAAIHLVYGTLRDKAVDEICGLLFPRAASVILTEPRQSRGLKAETLADMTRHLAPNCEIVRDPAAALERAVQLAAPEDAIFATGSLYLVADYRRGWERISQQRGLRAASARTPASARPRI